MPRRALTISIDGKEDIFVLVILHSDMTPSLPRSCRTDAGQMVIPASIAIALTCPFVKIAGPLPTYDMISP